MLRRCSHANAAALQDSDGYQPFLVAPENGYRALVREGVKLMEPPSAAAVDAVDMVLRDVGQKVRFLDEIARDARGPCIAQKGIVHCPRWLRGVGLPSSKRALLTMLMSALQAPIDATRRALRSEHSAGCITRAFGV